jgi:hypothetical protein
MRKVKLTRYMLLSTLIVFIGAIFKVQHWPGSHIIMLIGLLFGIILLAVYYKSDNSN